MYEVTQHNRRSWTLADGGDKPRVMLTEESPGVFDLAKKYDLSVEDLRRLHAAIGVALTDLAGERVDCAAEVSA